MKNHLLFPALLLLCLAVAACSRKEEPAATMEKAGDAVKQAAAKTADAIGTATENTKAAAVAAGDAIGDKLKEWKLTPADLKEELATSGRVVRSRSTDFLQKTSEVIDNARLVTIINGRYIADRDLSSFKINVDATQGVVTLKGTVKSAELLGRAIALALDTDGVRQVVSELTVES
jgi:hypothetical protein